MANALLEKSETSSLIDWTLRSTERKSCPTGTVDEERPEALPVFESPEFVEEGVVSSAEVGAAV
jgi:hypothetical protein